MREKVKVVLADGSHVTLTEWQNIYGLPVDSDKIGKYFSLTEQRFLNDITAYGELIVNELLMRVLDAFREAVDQPIRINSFNRSDEHQKDLKLKGFKTATFSPHVAKLAADIDTDSATQTRAWAKILLQVGSDLGIAIRVGFAQYLAAGQTFIHVDVCPEYYRLGKPYSKKMHPAVWAKQITW